MRGLYHTAEALCATFVSVYLWINSHDFVLVCSHYLTLYVFTGATFLVAGWLAKAGDRVNVYRIGIALHAVFYGTLLYLQESAPRYAIPLGVLLGIAWGFYWAGVKTIDYDLMLSGHRDYFVGLLVTVSETVKLLGPLAGAAIIYLAPQRLTGYLTIFACALVIYIVCVIVSTFMPPDRSRKPYRILPVLFPPKHHRDWRLLLLASGTMAGAFSILPVFLGLAMFLHTNTEWSVGGFASFQALVGVCTSIFLARTAAASTRRRSFLVGTVLVVVAGVVVGLNLSPLSLMVFGLLYAAAMPLLTIPLLGLIYDVVAECITDNHERIEYIVAWEIPLTIGRAIVMITMMALSGWLAQSEIALRVTIFLLCSMRLLTYYLLTRTDVLRRNDARELATVQEKRPPEEPAAQVNS